MGPAWRGGLGTQQGPDKVPALLGYSMGGETNHKQMYSGLGTAGLFLNIKQGNGVEWCIGRVVRKDRCRSSEFPADSSPPSPASFCSCRSAPGCLRKLTQLFLVWLCTYSPSFCVLSHVCLLPTPYIINPLTLLFITYYSVSGFLNRDLKKACPSQAAFWEEVPGRGNSRCKGPKAGKGGILLGEARELRAGMERESGRS